MSETSPARPPAAAPCPPLQDFADEVLALYAAPLRAAPTRDKVRQALGLVMGLPGAATVADLTPATVALLVRDLMGRGLSESHIAGVLAHLRAACDLAVRRGYLPSNPVEARRRWLPYGYGGRPVVAGPGALTDDQLKRLLVRLLDGSFTWEGHRLFALVALVTYAGLRRNEALEAAVTDFDLAAGTLRVAKGSPATRLRRLPPPLVPILGEWLENTGCPHAFPGTLRQGPWTGGPSGAKAIDGVREAGLSVGVEGLTFERLRAAWQARAGRVALPGFERLAPPPRTHPGPRPGRPGPQPGPAVLVLIRAHLPPIVRGRELDRPLSRRRYKILQAMLDAGCDRGRRITGRELDERSKCRDSVRELFRIAKLPGLEDVIDFPGRKARGGYGLKSARGRSCIANCIANRRPGDSGRPIPALRWSGPDREDGRPAGA